MVVSFYYNRMLTLFALDMLANFLGCARRRRQKQSRTCRLPTRNTSIAQPASLCSGRTVGLRQAAVVAALRIADVATIWREYGVNIVDTYGISLRLSYEGGFSVDIDGPDFTSWDLQLAELVGHGLTTRIGTRERTL